MCTQHTNIHLGNREDFPRMSRGVSDNQFDRMNKQCDLYVPAFYSLDNIVINKKLFSRSDTDTLKAYYQDADKDDIDSELMDVDDFNFYLDHVHSVLDHVLKADFFEFYK